MRKKPTNFQATIESSSSSCIYLGEYRRNICQYNGFSAADSVRHSFRACQRTGHHTRKPLPAGRVDHPPGGADDIAGMPVLDPVVCAGVRQRKRIHEGIPQPAPPCSKHPYKSI